MAKYTHPDVQDGSLLVVRGAANLMVVTNGLPASYAAAQAGKLAEVAMVAGDFTLGAGSPNGRRAVVAAKSAVPVTASGSGDHVCLLDTVNSRLLHATDCPAQSLTSGGTTNIASWSFRFADPA